MPAPFAVRPNPSAPPDAGVEKITRRIGWFCLIAGALLIAPAFWLGGAGPGARVGGFALTQGVALGALLAGITRTRRPLLIYAALLASALVIWPLWQGWPSADIEAGGENAIPAGGQDALARLATYLDALRYGLFFLGIPYPFARLGRHAPDEPEKGSALDTSPGTQNLPEA